MSPLTEPDPKDDKDQEKSNEEVAVNKETQETDGTEEEST
jgi:hypothetical protein